MFFRSPILLAVFWLSGLAFAKSSSKSAPLIPIRLAVLESFSISETASIERMRSAYESALYYAIGENENRLNACGYSVKLTTEYYDNADKLAPKERATYLENSGVHLILGPRRSEQYLVATHGLSRTPIISSAASADDVQRLKPPFFTMYPFIEDFSSALLKALAKEKFGKSYGSAYDVTCIACRDFERKFDEMSKKDGYQRRFSLEVTGDVPDIKPLVAVLRKEPIDFLFLPVYAKAAGFIIASLQREFPNLRYVGTHSWGDGAYGLLEDYKIDPKVRGIAVNASISPQMMGEVFKVWSLDRETRTGGYGPPSSAYRVIDFIRIMTKDLCDLSKKKKALKNKDDFYRHFSNLSARHFQKNQVLGIFKLENGEYQFSYRVTP